MATTILTDIGNVVVFFDNRRTSQAIAEFSSLDVATIHRLLFQGPDRLTKGVNRGEDVDSFRRVAMRRLGCIDRMSPQQFDRAYTDVFTLNGPVIRLYDRLTQQGAVLTAISDIDELRRDRLVQLGVMSLFHQVVLSFEEKEVKPSRRLMELALRRSRATAATSVFIDDLAENLVPAQGLGIATHLYKDDAGLAAFLQRNGLAV